MAESSEMAAFKAQLGEHHLAPMWDVLRTLVTREPQPTAEPVLWKAGLVRDQILRAGEVISAEQAERRVLILENPAFKGQAKATNSLFGGVQLILPGETARSHRHTAAAIRFILEGDGAYTSVEGEKVMMGRGDFIITPSWLYHDHGNQGTGPVMWLDGLDMHFVNLMNVSFAQEDPNIRSVPPKNPDDIPRMTFAYPYDVARRSLEEMRKSQPADAALGWKRIYLDPKTGAPPMNVMAAFLQLIPAHWAGAQYRSTDSAMFVVVEGEGVAEVGGRRWQIAPNDIFVVPAWAWTSFATGAADLVLFSLSDRTIQQHLGFWREEREPPG
jgi:gentisate 1,2-dioxygenase